MVEKKDIPVAPVASVHHDKVAYTIEIKLPGVDKKDIEFEASAHHFSVSAPRDHTKYSWSWALVHKVDPKKAKATYTNGLLRVTLPVVERVKGEEISIE